jgi:hypothetical protein
MYSQYLASCILTQSLAPYQGERAMPDRIARFLALSQCCLQRTTAAAVSMHLSSWGHMYSYTGHATVTPMLISMEQYSCSLIIYPKQSLLALGTGRVPFHPFLARTRTSATNGGLWVVKQKSILHWQYPLGPYILCTPGRSK